MNAVEVKSPGCFSAAIAADNRRFEFDLKNEAILQEGTLVDAVFLGDSITHFWELGAYFKSEEGLILNRGISGDTTKYIRIRIEADVLQLKPRNLVLLAGINDLWPLEVFPWNYDKTVYDPQVLAAECVENLTAVIKQAAEAGIQVAVCSVLPSNLPWSTKSDLRNELILEINRNLRRAAENLGAVYVDYHTAFADTDGKTLRDGFSQDGIHPQAAGYKVMSSILCNALRESGIRLSI